MHSVLIPLGLICAATAAVAEPCDKAVTQTRMTQCAGVALARADAALDASYRKVTDRLVGDAAARKLITEAQATWTAFRKAECAFSTSGSIGGSVHPMAEAGCRQMLTEARTKMLEGYLSCEEGDVACPLPPR